MDYCELLYKAQENNRTAETKKVRCYTTAFDAPKKIERSKVSSENIKKFLARKEEEEKRKLMEAKRKKDELLALRSQDKKAQKRVQVMLKRTKSANKSVMEDAIDNVNTADTLAGPKQCDEDDYGYVSQEASAFYNKLIDKYQNMSSEKSVFSKTKREVKDLNAAKDRVKAALQKESEEELLPHKRKRKVKDKEKDEGDVLEQSNNNESQEKMKKVLSETDIKKEIPVKKKVRPAPPPVDFEQLLKIAEKKQYEPIVIEKIEVQKEERLMTKKEKLEYMKEKERRNKKNVSKLAPPVVKESTGIEGKVKSSKLKLSTSSVSDNNKTKNIIKTAVPLVDSQESHKSSNSVECNTTKSKPPNEIPVSEKLKKNSQVWAKPCNLSNKIPVKNSNGSAEICKKVVNRISHDELLKKNNVLGKKNLAKSNIKPNQIKNPVDDNELSEIDREIELLRRKRELLANRASVVKENNDSKTDSKIKSKPLLTKENKPRQPSSVPSKRMKRNKRRLDSDSEYDSELEDFIDDGPEAECADYSKQIQEIFGYDRSRYKYEEEDDECMESNFAQQMKEEYVSTKIGILEDLEDIRKEQEEKARKKVKKLKR